MILTLISDTFQLCRSSPDICQLRLSFETFSVSGPSSLISSDNLATPRTQCLAAQFSAHSGAASLPLMCGTSSGQHMILGRPRPELSHSCDN